MEMIWNIYIYIYIIFQKKKNCLTNVLTGSVIQNQSLKEYTMGDAACKRN